MTITTVLHSPYTPGRPRAARTRPACELRPGPSRSRGLFYCPGRTVRTRPGSRGPGLLAVMSCSRKTRAPCRDPEQSSELGARPGQSGLTSPTTMLWSPLSLSQHLAIMSSLARTRPKPSTHTSHPLAYLTRTVKYNRLDLSGWSMLVTIRCHQYNVCKSI